MANASAKKAAVARASAANTFRLIIFGTNAIYILFCFGKRTEDVLKFWPVAGMITVWIVEYFAYQGILDNAANRKPDDKSLVGGSYLDLLAISFLIQFGSILYSNKVYYLLIGVPVWGVWTTYKMLLEEGKLKSGGAAATPREPNTEDKALADKRQKRAERRKQKRT